MAILIQDKVDYTKNKITKTKRHITHDERINPPGKHDNPNVYTPTIRASKYMKQKRIELKEEIDKSTMTFGKLNIFLSEVDRTTRQKINRNTEGMNNKINQQDLVKIKT